MPRSDFGGKSQESGTKRDFIKTKSTTITTKNNVLYRMDLHSNMTLHVTSKATNQVTKTTKTSKLFRLT